MTAANELLQLERNRPPCEENVCLEPNLRSDESQMTRHAKTDTTWNDTGEDGGMTVKTKT